MSIAVLSCTTLRPHVNAAQETCGTCYPVFYLDNKYHADPALMREKILETIETIPASIDTILVCMGFCGGSWQDVTCSRRLVIPRVDDCVSLVMTTTDRLCINTKEMGHMYVFGDDRDGFSIGSIYDSSVEKYGEELGETIFDMMFENYRHVDIVDTGLYDCYDPAFVEKVQRDADRIHGQLDFVPGGNLLLEKLFSGNWDHQFFISEPNSRITQGSFFDL